MLKEKYACSIKVKNETKNDLISREHIDEMFLDGRVASPWVERILEKILKNYKKDNEEKSFDAYLNGNKCEIKNLNSKGLKTCPSSMIGTGRKYDKEIHQKILEENAYYIICDLTEVGYFNYYILKSSSELLFKKLSYKHAKDFLKSVSKDCIIFSGDPIEINY